MSETNDKITVAALGVQFKELAGQITRLETAWDEKAGDSSFDPKPIEEALVKSQEDLKRLGDNYLDRGKKIEAMEKDIDALREASRKGQKPNFDVGNLDEMTVKRGKYAGKKVRQVLDVYRLVTSAYDRAVSMNALDLGIKKCSKELNETVEELRIYTPDNTGLGAEWAASLTREGVWNALREKTRVLSQFEGMVIDMMADDLKIPFGMNRTDWLKGSVGVEPASADVATGNVTMTVTELVKLFKWAYSFDESTLFEVMTYIETYLEWTGSLALDKFFMNAHNITAATGSVMSDDQAPPSSSYYLTNGQNGMVVQALLDNTAMATNLNAALTDALLLSIVSPMDEFGHDVENVVHFPEWRTYLNGYRKMSTVDTIEKFGPQARVKSGQVAIWSGSAVVPTAALGLAEADGKLSATAANNTLGRTVVVHIPSWMIGLTRRLLIETVVDPLKRAKYLIGSVAPALAAVGERASNQHTAIGYNITV